MHDVKHVSKSIFTVFLALLLALGTLFTPAMTNVASAATSSNVVRDFDQVPSYDIAVIDPFNFDIKDAEFKQLVDGKGTFFVSNEGGVSTVEYYRYDDGFPGGGTKRTERNYGPIGGDNFSLRWPERAMDVDGHLYDVEVVVSDFHLHTYLQDKTNTSFVCMSSSADGALWMSSGVGNNVENGIYIGDGRSYYFGCEYNVTVRYYDSSTGELAQGNSFMALTDLDIGDRYEVHSNNNPPYTQSNGSPYTYAEQVTLISGYTDDKAYVHPDSILNYDPSGKTFWGSAMSDNEGEALLKSTVEVNTDASGFTFSWAACLASTRLFEQPQAFKVQSGVKSGEETGKVTPIQDVFWKQNRNYTATPADGYHLTSLVIDGTEVDFTNDLAADGSYTYKFEGITVDHTFVAGFEKDVPGLAISKDADVEYAKVGDKVTYTISVTNGGSSTVKGINVEDMLPDGFEADYTNCMCSFGGKTYGDWFEDFTKDGHSYIQGAIYGLESGDTAVITIPGIVTSDIVTSDADEDHADKWFRNTATVSTDDGLFCDKDYADVMMKNGCKLTVFKYDEYWNKTPIEGVEFELEGAFSLTDENGYAYFDLSNVEEGHPYILREIRNDRDNAQYYQGPSTMGDEDSYRWGTVIEFRSGKAYVVDYENDRLVECPDNVVEISNKPLPLNLTFTKVDGGSGAHVDATFGLFTDENCSDPVMTASGLTSATSSNGKFSFYVDSDAGITGPAGQRTLYMKEIAASDGYELSDAVYVIDVRNIMYDVDEHEIYNISWCVFDLSCSDPYNPDYPGKCIAESNAGVAFGHGVSSLDIEADIPNYGTPTIEKAIVGGDDEHATDAAIGDTVHFQITVHTPDLSFLDDDDMNYTFAVLDNADGMNIDLNSVSIQFNGSDTVVVGDGAPLVQIFDNLIGNDLDLVNERGFGMFGPGYPTYWTPLPSVMGDGVTMTSLAVVFDVDCLRANLMSDSGIPAGTITIDYDATLMNSAERVNTNTAWLRYTADPRSFTLKDSDEVSCDVYTYAWEITKHDVNDASCMLPDAVFNVERDIDGHRERIPFNYDANDGVYRPLDDEDNANKDTSYDLVTDENGKIRIFGIDDGMYILMETQAPDGYQLAPDGEYVIDVHVSDEGEVATGEMSPNWTAEFDTQHDDVLTFYSTIGDKILAGQTIEMPFTGRDGIIAATAVGLVVVAGSMVWLLIRRRRRAE